jgi:2,3-bisphosphoglycerate-independent phosphoglycerate mutase
MALLARLAQRNDRRIVLLVLDGIGDLRTAEQPRTALEEARTANLDRLAARSALGRLVPAGTGVTPGSGPGHLALFGYEPTSPDADIGRGVLEALGLGLDFPPDVVVARCNFATVDEAGQLLDRRAGRIPTEEGERICALLAQRIEAAGGVLGDDVRVEVHPGEAYRFVLLFRAAEGTPPLDPGLRDTDPQRLGVPPLGLEAAIASGADGGDAEAARETVRRIAPAVEALQEELRAEERANTFLLRGFSSLPALPGVGELYRLRAAALAGYPLYRGVAKACGMDVVDCGKPFGQVLDRLEERWSDFDYFFLHVKGADMAGEDGDLAAKVRVIEEVDALLPRLLELEPDVLAITGDHSTPAPMKAHSWHPVPLLLWSETCFVDGCSRFTEVEASRGAIGTIPSSDLMGLLLANAGKLGKFGA